MVILLNLWLIYHAKLFATNFLPNSPSTRCFFFYSEFRFLWSEYSSSALSILTPQTLAILRTWTPAVQVQGPFHWRVQWPVGCATKACFTWPDLLLDVKYPLYTLEELREDDFHHVQINRPSHDKVALFKGIEVFVDWISQNSPPQSGCIHLQIASDWDATRNRLQEGVQFQCIWSNLSYRTGQTWKGGRDPGLPIFYNYVTTSWETHLELHAFPSPKLSCLALVPPLWCLSWTAAMPNFFKKKSRRQTCDRVHQLLDWFKML